MTIEKIEEAAECKGCRFECHIDSLNNGEYCNLCYGTMTSSLSRSYDYPGEKLVLEAICFVGNTILKAIEDSKDGN